MAASDARPIPRKNTTFRVTFGIFDADGDLVTGASDLDSEVSKDGGTFADCTNEATEIATSSGIYYLDLTSDEMNADTVAIIVKTSTPGAKTTVIVMYPAEAGDVLMDGEITAAKIATDAIDADALAADAIAEINTTVDTAISDAALATAANLATVAGYIDTEVAAVLAAVDTEVAAILADTNELQTDWANGGRLDLILDARASQTSVDDLPTNAELTTALAAADDAVLAAIAALNNLSAAQVNAEVLDVLATDTFAEPTAVPAATSSLKDKLNWLFALARNKFTMTSAGAGTLYRDDGSTATATRTDTDSAGTYTKGEWS